ncbi:MAG: PAS-domain containing protein, partial [Aeoliella sp.]
YTLRNLVTQIDQLTEARTPATMASLHISRQAERIGASAPGLLASRNEVERSQRYATIRRAIDRVDEVADEFGDANGSNPARNRISAAFDEIESNLAELHDVVGLRLAKASERESRQADLRYEALIVERMLAPQLILIDSRLHTLREQHSKGPSAANAAGSLDVAAMLLDTVPFERALLEARSLAKMLGDVSEASTKPEITALRQPLNRAVARLRSLALYLDTGERSAIESSANGLARFVAGIESLADLRSEELDIVQQGNRLLMLNDELTTRLASIVDDLVSATRKDISATRSEVTRLGQQSTRVLALIAASSLLLSLLIAWLYVDGNLIRRLNALTLSAREIATGNYEAQVPEIRPDELGQLSDALITFRETAREVAQSNLREIDTARRRLNDAVESLADGFMLLDADERLVLANQAWHGYMGGSDVCEIGTPLEEIVSFAADRRVDISPFEDKAAWKNARLEFQRSPGETFLTRHVDGRWLNISVRRTAEGGSTTIYNDVTDIKRREAELSAILDTIDYGVLFLDANMRIRLSNSRYREIWGLSEDFLATQPLLSEDIERSLDSLAGNMGDEEWRTYVEERVDLVRSGKMQMHELNFPDGSVIRVQPVTLPYGERMLTYYEITDLRKRERELAEAARENEQLVSELNAVLDNIAYGVAFADSDSRVRLANRAFREMWDIDDELMDKRPTIRHLFLHAWFKGYYDMDEEKWPQFLEARLNDIRQGDVSPREMRRTDGRTLLYEVRSLPNGVRMAMYFDITNLKRAEEKLKESEERYELVIDGSNEGWWDWTADLDRITTSERLREIAHLAPETSSIRPESWGERIHAEDRQQHRDGWR